MNESELLRQLKEAYNSFFSADIELYSQKLKTVKEFIDAQPEKTALYGEWLLVLSLADIFDLDAQCEKYAQAAFYIKGRSRVFPPYAQLFGEYYNPFAMCNRSPGHAQENAEKLERAVELFFSLTGGGKGTDICYRAQLAFYRGEFDKAQQLAEKAFETARRYKQEHCFLCALDLLAQIAKHTCNENLWQYAYYYIQDIAEGSCAVSRSCCEMAQVLYAMLNLSLGLIKALPDWIIAGDFGVVSTPWGYRVLDDKICSGTFPNALTTQIQYYLYRSNPYGKTFSDSIKALNIADAAQKIYGIENLIAGIYYDFFRALAHFSLGVGSNKKYITAFLRSAMQQLIPDGLYLAASEFVPVFAEEIYEIAGNADAAAPAKIRAIGENYWDKLSLFREDVIRDTRHGFTKREAEVAVLIAAGKSNAEIALNLCISERTVEKHTAKIFSKLNVSRRAHVADAVKKQPPETAFWTKIEKLHSYSMPK